MPPPESDPAVAAMLTLEVDDSFALCPSEDEFEVSVSDSGGGSCLVLLPVLVVRSGAKVIVESRVVGAGGELEAAYGASGYEAPPSRDGGTVFGDCSLVSRCQAEGCCVWFDMILFECGRQKSADVTDK